MRDDLFSMLRSSNLSNFVDSLPLPMSKPNDLRTNSIQTPLVNRWGHNHQITFLISPFWHQIGHFHVSDACSLVLHRVHYLKSTWHRSYVLVCMGYLPSFRGQKAFVPTTLYPASTAATCTSRARQASCFSPRFLVPSPPRSDKKLRWQYLDMWSTLGLVINGVISSKVKWSYAKNRPNPTIHMFATCSGNSSTSWRRVQIWIKYKVTFSG